MFIIAFAIQMFQTTFRFYFYFLIMDAYMPIDILIQYVMSVNRNIEICAIAVFFFLSLINYFLFLFLYWI